MKDIFKKINSMNESEIEKALKNVKETEDLNRMAVEICHDKEECRLLQIPYTEITAKDFRKAQLYIHLLDTKKYKI